MVSGPSGSGKTTLCRAFTAADENAFYATSATTRSPREGEKDGDDYFFLTRDDFEKRATRGEFLEYAEVHGNLYGTLKSEVIEHIRAGRDVLMDIDVQGADLVRGVNDTIIQNALIDIFILPPNDEELANRLDSRGTETREQLDLRLHNAHEEMSHWQEYGYTIVSGSREQDLAAFEAVLTAERHRSSRYRASDFEIKNSSQAELDL